MFILDFTVDFGDGKLLLILGVPLDTLAANDKFMPTHADTEVLHVEHCTSSNGEMVHGALEQAAAKVGIPHHIVSDGGSDIQKGIRLFIDDNPTTIPVYDITHKSAIFLKSYLKNDERWEAFTQSCGECKRSSCQTPVAFLAPPKPTEKCRYLNFPRYVKWGNNMLSLMELEEIQSTIGNEFEVNEAFFQQISEVLHTDLEPLLGPLQGQTFPDSDTFFRAVVGEFYLGEEHASFEKILLENAHTGRQYLKKYYGWLRRFSSELKSWSQVIDALDLLKTELKHNSLSIETADRCREKLATLHFDDYSSIQLPIEAYLDEQTARLAPGDRLLSSSDIEESLFGKLKNFVNRSPLREIGKNLLLVPLFVTPLTTECVKQALESTRLGCVSQWMDENLPQSNFSRRKQAYSLLG